MSRTASADAPPRLHRSADDRLVAGVAAGLAQHLGLDVLLVRLGFAVLAVLGGLGVLLYAGFWAVVPLGQPSDARPAPPGDRAARRTQLLALLAIATGGLLVVRQLGWWLSDAVVFPAMAGAAGAALIWQQADEAQRARWSRLPAGARWAGADRERAALVRVVAGAALIAAGVAGFLAANDELHAARQGLVAAAVVLLGTALLTAPWWLRLATDLAEERRERIRSEERAEVAAHLHDSVLQTLALIQRHAGDPQQVQRLARSQERELRGWLYARPGADGGRLADALTGAAADVEDRHGVRVEVVSVGDCPLDEATGALVLAAREAIVNAAKFAGVPSVDVYLEVEPDRVTAFVRDTGAGFDPGAVPADRRGLADSVIGRMARHGGTATVRSHPGEGTEVELALPRERP